MDEICRRGQDTSWPLKQVFHPPPGRQASFPFFTSVLYSILSNITQMKNKYSIYKCPSLFFFTCVSENCLIFLLLQHFMVKTHTCQIEENKKFPYYFYACLFKFRHQKLNKDWFTLDAYIYICLINWIKHGCRNFRSLSMPM